MIRTRSAEIAELLAGAENCCYDTCALQTTDHDTSARHGCDTGGDALGAGTFAEIADDDIAESNDNCSNLQLARDPHHLP